MKCVTPILFSVATMLAISGCKARESNSPDAETMADADADDPKDSDVKVIVDQLGALDQLEVDAADPNFQCDKVKSIRANFSGNSYRIETALRLGQFSAPLAYQKVVIIKDGEIKTGVIADFAKQLGFNKIEIVSAVEGNADSQAYIFSNNTVIVVVFRGTQKKKPDFLTDLDLRKQESGFWGTSIHSGFDKAYRAIQGKLFSALTANHGFPEIFNSNGLTKPDASRQRKVKQFYIAGHSLGGALATLLAGDMAQREIWIRTSVKHPEKANIVIDSKTCDQFDVDSQQLQIDGVYTFGSPRVGNKEFAKCYDAALKDRTYRFVNKNDIVPRIPKVNYQHVGQQYYIESKGDIKVDPNGLQKFWDRGFWGNLDARKWIADHSNYSTSLAYLISGKDASCPFEKAKK